MDINGMTTRAKILILFANAYDMLDERSRQRTGCTVRYLFWGEQGERLLEQSEWNPDRPVGLQPAKCSMDYDLRAKVPYAPALYEGEFEMTVGGDGKPVLRLRDVAFISMVRISQHVVPGLAVPGMVVPAAEPAPAEPPSAELAGEPAAEPAPAAPGKRR